TRNGQALTTSYSAEAMRAYFDGEFSRLLEAADAFVDTPTGGWDMQVRGLRACLRVLRGEPVPGDRPVPGQRTADRPGGVAGQRSRPPVDDITDALAAARGGGFHRPHWTTLGMAALCRALQGRSEEAAALLDELADSWSAVPALASGEWIAAAAYAASLVGRDSAVRVRGMLDQVGHRTPWAEAALRTVTAAVAAADGDHSRAGELHLAAADIYARIPDTTDRMLALALAAGELGRSPGNPLAAQALAEVRGFALRNQAPGLLRLGQLGEAASGWSPELAS
ncbi:MAG TPA: adenylyl cyclase, partial [Micromonospora sp.]